MAPTVYGNIKKFLQDCCDNATAVVTVSDAVRADILAHLGISADKVVNLSQAVSFDAELLMAAVTAEPICPEGGFLYFGILERRKNLARLIRAHGQSGSQRPLTLIGRMVMVATRYGRRGHVIQSLSVFVSFHGQVGRVW